jgi:hypothetical protein
LRVTQSINLHRALFNFSGAYDLCTSTGEIHRITHFLHLLPQINRA